MKHIPP